MVFAFALILTCQDNDECIVPDCGPRIAMLNSMASVPRHPPTLLPYEIPTLGSVLER
jgi:hypothetical protein